MQHILLAGATGYLGNYIAKELVNRGFLVSIITRDKSRFLSKNINVHKIYEGDLFDPNFYCGIMYNVDVVISTIGITKQKDGKTYMDVDYGINRLLLDEALKAGVDKFVYVSVLHGQRLKHLKICEAKERFVDELQSSNIDSLIIRPSGFYSDLEEFLSMAKQGKVYLFGDGSKKLNPIHGADLANVVVNAINLPQETLEVGGPEVFTHKQIASLAFKALENEAKIIYIPDWIRRAALSMIRTFTTQKTYGPVEFFLTVMDIDMSCQQFGQRTLLDHFNRIKELKEI